MDKVPMPEHLNIGDTKSIMECMYGNFTYDEFVHYYGVSLYRQRPVQLTPAERTVLVDISYVKTTVLAETELPSFCV